MCSKFSVVCDLHGAVLENSLEMVNKALSEHENKLLDCEMTELGTPLLTSIKRRADHNIIKRLIEAGSNINAKDASNKTPLHYAVEDRSTQLTIMFLHYGADPSIRCDMGYTAFDQALTLAHSENALVLVDYYDSHNVNLKVNTGLEALAYCLTTCKNMKLFKRLWPLLSSDGCKYVPRGFLEICLDGYIFSGTEWIECLYVMLKTKSVLELIRMYDGFRYVSCQSKEILFFCEFLIITASKKIQQNDVLSFIYLICSLGVKVNCNVFNIVITYYGINEEFEALLFASNYSFDDCLSIKHPFGVIFSGNDFISATNEYFKEYIKSTLARYKCNNNLWKFDELGFFSMPSCSKGDMITYCYKKCNETSSEITNFLSWKLETLPNFPTLLELSRNKVLKSIKLNYKIEYWYEIFQIVSNLQIPKLCKNIILFKCSIY